MYDITRTSYGYKLTFGGSIGAAEMTAWAGASKRALLGAPRKFGVFVDMRTLTPLLPDAQAAMVEGQRLFKERGMERSVVIVENDITKMQFERLAKSSGIYAWERYISAARTPDWEKMGQSWVVDGVDPDK